MTDSMDTAAPDLSEADAGASNTVVSDKDLYYNIIHRDEHETNCHIKQSKTI
jgi:hypothetical protein